MARTRRVDILIAGEDRSKQAFKGVGASAEKAERQIGQAGEGGGRKFDSGLKGALQRAKAAFKGVTDDADRAAEGIGRSGGDAGESFLGSLKGGLAGLGPAAGFAAVGAGLVAAFGAALDIEPARDKLVAQLDLTAVEAERIGGVAADLYADAFGGSLGEVNEAVRRVIVNFDGLRDASAADLERITSKALTVADVFDQDLSMAMQAAGQMVRTGLADNADEALDVLVRGMQLGADKADDLLETFQEYSTMFRDLGIDAEDSLGLMVQGLQAGARDSDKVADALKELAIRAQDNSTTSAEGFRAIGLSAEEMTAKFAEGGPAAREGLDQVLDGLRAIEDPVERNEAAVALFGAQAEDLGDALFALDLDTAAGGLGRVEGAAEGAGSAYDNAATRVEAFKRGALQTLTTFIAEQVIPRLEDFGEWLAEEGKPHLDAFVAFVKEDVVPALRDFAEWWVENGPEVAGEAVTMFRRIVDGGQAIIGFFLAGVESVAAFKAALRGDLAAAKDHMNNALEHWQGAQANWRDASTQTATSVRRRGGEQRDDLNKTISRVRTTGGAFVGLKGDVDRLPRRASISTSVFGATSASRALHGVRDAARSIPSVVSTFVSMTFSQRRALRQFDVGGRVPGPLGQPQLAVVHGGETIVPTHDPARMRRLADDLDPIGVGLAGAGGGVTVVNIDLSGAVIASQQQFERMVVNAIRRAGRKGTRVDIRGRRL